MSNRKLRDLHKEYRFSNPNARFGVTADAAGNELERIEQAHGHLTSGLVVDEARPKAAVLHPAFEWDDWVAAEHYRKKQAASLIRAVIEVKLDTSGIPEHRAYVLTRVETETRPVYMTMDAVIQSPGLFADAVERLEKQVQQALSSVNEIKALAAQQSEEPERMARIALAVTALSAASTAVAALH